ncbi:ACT domain-containing protein [Mesorhizobium sp. M0514]|uniref:ACT domain-containing protein n=1 Tax=Mesorhizobium sp. M0514 TaxID=2956955 RepID=UPI003334CB80
MAVRVRLKPLTGRYAVSRLEAKDSIPGWAEGPGFVSITRTDDELSVVCLQDRVPDGESELGIFLVSTFDGDHLLVKAKDEAAARGLLVAAGHTLL